jgi:putative ABC transport system permease protein
VKVSSDTFPDVVGSRVERTIEGVSVVISAQLVKSVEKQLSTLMKSLMLVTGAFWAASTLLVGTIFSMTTNERRREIGLLRAMGATGTFISKMVLTEATLLTLLGGIFGVIGGGVAMFSFSLLISTALDVPYLWPTLAQVVQMIATSIIVAILTGLLASLFPAIVGGRMEPLNAIRSGE